MNHCSVFADAHPLHSFPACFCFASNLSLHKQQYKNPPNNYEIYYMFLALLVVLPFFIWVLLGCLVFKNGFIFLDLTPI